MSTGRSGALALVVAVVIASAACARSELDADAAVVVTGLVRTPAGEAAADVAVSLTRDPSAADVFGGLGAGGATLGLACAVEPRPRLCTDGARRTETGDDGRFTFDMTGRDTQDNLGFANDFALEAVLPATESQLAGPITTSRFLIQRELLELGDVRTWGPAVAVTGGPGTVRATWTAPPPELGITGEAEVVFDGGTSGVVWAQPGAGTAAELDARLLEGANGGAAVVVSAEGQAPGTDTTTTYRSPTVGYASAALPPVSRGKPCTGVDSTGASRTLSPCPLTDGRFLAPDQTPVEAAIDLGQQVEATLVAVRGCSGECTVEISGDGAGWAPLFTATTPFAAFTPPAGTAPRFVRLAGGVDDPSITELSVFTGPAPSTAGLLPDIVPADLDAATDVYGQGQPDDDDGIPVAGLVAAALLAAAAAGAAGFRWGRRSTPAS